jgi:oligoribonuclease
VSKADPAKKLFWLDMEMTGLEIEKEVPIEVAAVVTDWDFSVLDQYHAVICQPQKFLDAMDDWNKKHHGESGLTALVPGGKAPDLVDAELAGLIEKHFSAKERAVLAGNSISQDRLFIRRYMPKTESKLHYRMLDVTAWKVVFNGKFELKFSKKDGHRALDDIHESIAELKYYLSFVRT